MALDSQTSNSDKSPLVENNPKQDQCTTYRSLSRMAYLWMAHMGPLYYWEPLLLHLATPL